MISLRLNLRFLKSKRTSNVKEWMRHLGFEDHESGGLHTVVNGTRDWFVPWLRLRPQQCLFSPFANCVHVISCTCAIDCQTLNANTVYLYIIYIYHISIPASLQRLMLRPTLDCLEAASSCDDSFKIILDSHLSFASSTTLQYALFLLV